MKIGQIEKNVQSKLKIWQKIVSPKTSNFRLSGKFFAKYVSDVLRWRVSN